MNFDELPVEIRDSFIEAAAATYIEGMTDTLAALQAFVDETRENIPTLTDAIEQIRLSIKTGGEG